MAKLEAVLTADISPFQKALAQAAEKAREFGKGTADVGKDLFKSLSGFDIGKALGIAGATYAAAKLGEALIDAAKEGLKAFEAYQDAVLRFKYAVPTAPGAGAFAAGRAEETAETAAGKAGMFSAEQMRSAALLLQEASKQLRESPEKLNDMLDTLKAFAIKTATTPEQIAEAYRRLIVGIKEEGGMAVGKFFKATPGLEEETEKLRDAHAQAYLHAQGLTDASEANTAQAAEYHRLQREPIAEFMVEESKRKGATAVLEEIKGILERSAPKAIVAEAEELHPEKKLAALWEEASAAFGKSLKPAIDDFVKMILEHMPAINELMSGFGTGLKIVIEGVLPALRFFSDVIEGLGRAVAMVLDKIGSFIGAPVGVAEKAAATSREVDERIEAEKKIREDRHAAAEEEKDAAKERAAIEDEANKAAVKSAEEVAKIRARTSATHEESQRRISFEVAQAELRATAIAAARAAVIDRPRGSTELLDKEYAIEAESTAKIINIRASAAEKINAADEEAAERIAKIDEEQNLRNIDRATANAMDEGAEKSATLARLNAEDDAAALSRDDAHAAAAEKIREADMDAANAIIDAQEAAAEKRIDAEKSAALAVLEKMPGPYAIEEAPGGRENIPEFGKWKTGPGGYAYYEESAFERKQREERNAAAKEANRQWKEMERMIIDKEFEDKKRALEDALERQRPTEIGLKRTHILQQEEHVKAIEAEKGRTEADQEFARAHESLALPIEPKKEPTGAADVSRKVLAEILAKMFANQNTQIKEFEDVFIKE